MPTRVLVLGAHPSRGHALRRLSRLTASAWERSGAQVQVLTPPDGISRRAPRAQAAEQLAAAENATWLTRQVRRASADLDLVHVVDARDVLYTSPLAGRVPIAVTCHEISGLAEAAEGGRRAHPVRRLRARGVIRGLNRADTLIATSRFTADAVEELTGRRAQLLYPPLDPSLAERPSRQEAWSPPGWPYLMTVGGPEPHTRRAEVIIAWSHLRRTAHLDGASLVVVGPPLTPDEEDLVTACGGHVSVFTDISDVKLSALYGRARAVLALGRPRSFLWPIAEAHRAGRPVLATDHPVFQEVGGAGCVYLPVEGIHRFDAGTWTSIAEDLMAPLVADRGSVNAERFAWHQFAEQLPAKALATATARPATREAVDLPAPVSVRLPLDDVTPAPTAAPDESVEPFGSNDFHAEVAAEVAAEIPAGLPAGLPEVPAAILAEDILRQPSFDRPPPLPEPAPAAYGLVLVGANPAGTRYLPPPFVDLQAGTPVAASH